MTKTKKAPKRAKVAKAETSLVLRVCAADMTSHGGFKWPGVGEVAIAKDWEAKPECGNGLHGWLHGQGDHSCADHVGNEDAKWLVVEVETKTIIQLGGKVKFPRGTVRFVGGRKDATDYLLAHDEKSLGVAVIGAQRQVGDKESVVVGALGTARAGDSGTATAGHRGTARAGHRGTATAGDRGTATAGDRGTATAGDRGTATAGDRGTATAGDRGTATAGDRGTATAGDSGTATAGDSGTARAGHRGTATAGDRGTATAGDRGTICIRYWDSKNSRYRTVIGYVGEDGIEPNVPYKLDAANKLVRA